MTKIFITIDNDDVKLHRKEFYKKLIQFIEMPVESSLQHWQVLRKARHLVQSWSVVSCTIVANEDELEQKIILNFRFYFRKQIHSLNRMYVMMQHSPSSHVNLEDVSSVQISCDQKLAYRVTVKSNRSLYLNLQIDHFRWNSSSTFNILSAACSSDFALECETSPLHLSRQVAFSISSCFPECSDTLF